MVYMFFCLLMLNISNLILHIGLVFCLEAAFVNSSEMPSRFNT